MRRYRLLLSVFIAVCLVCIAALLSRISLLPYILMTPGGIVLAVLGKGSHLVPNPLVLMLMNIGIYTLGISLCFLIGFSQIPELRLQRLTLWFGCAAVLLAVLASVPSINPLWPQGMEALQLQEADLRKSLPTGVTIEKASSVLTSKGIKFDVETEARRSEVMRDLGGVSIWADSGDRVMFSRFATEAFQYPCGYDMEIMLVFSADGLSKKTYINRFPMCP